MANNDDKPSTSFDIKDAKIERSTIAKTINNINIYSSNKGTLESSSRLKHTQKRQIKKATKMRKEHKRKKLEEIIPSITKLKEYQEKFEEENFILDVEESSYEDIENIFPSMLEIPVSSNDPVPKTEQYAPCREGTDFVYSQRAELPNAKKLSFSEVVAKIKQNKLLTLVGLPGAGKSYLCRRISRCFYQDSQTICILVKFMDLNFTPRDLKLTLRHLLLDNNFPGLSKDEYKSAFKWICDNDDNFLLILDGYDQADWRIKKNPSTLGYDKPQPVWDLVSNLYCKNYLPRSHVLLTSRPHSVYALPKNLRQKFTLHVIDISPDDVKKLFCIFTKSHSNELWEEISANAPQLASLCGNPLLLQLIIKACESSNVDEITSLTRLFSSVLDDLNDSNLPDNIDIQTVFRQIAELAFNTTFSNTVTITESNIKDVGLDVSTVHHLVITQQTGKSRQLIPGKKFMFFIHQTVQEYLTAYYIHEYMSPVDFRQFVQSKLFDSHWSIVRRFLFGITFDLGKDGGDQEWKRDLMKVQLIERIWPIRDVTNSDERRDLVDLLCDVREAADESFTMEVARHFPTLAWFASIPFSTSDIHAVSLVLRQVKGKIEDLDFIECDLSSTSFKFLVDAFKEMEGSVDRLSITGNKLRSEDVDGICIVLEKLNVDLDICECFDDGSELGRNSNQEEREKIQNKLNLMENTELKVIFEYDDDDVPIYLQKTA